MIAKIKKKERKIPLKEIFSYLLIVIFLSFAILFLFVNNLRVRRERLRLSSQIDNLKEKLNQAKAVENKLENEISQTESQENLEEIARDQLNFKKIGEEVVVIKKENGEEEKKEKEEESKSWWGVIRSVLFPK